VDAASDIAEFLTSRRAKVTPEQVGLPTYGPRRVQGLRREEVASLAGVSDLERSYEVMELPADHGLNIGVYSAEPESRSAQALDLLASWAATPPRLIRP
jgi:hypothetical protein